MTHSHLKELVTGQNREEMFRLHFDKVWEFWKELLLCGRHWEASSQKAWCRPSAGGEDLRRWSLLTSNSLVHNTIIKNGPFGIFSILLISRLRFFRRWSLKVAHTKAMSYYHRLSQKERPLGFFIYGDSWILSEADGPGIQGQGARTYLTLQSFKIWTENLVPYLLINVALALKFKLLYYAQIASSI